MERGREGTRRHLIFTRRNAGCIVVLAFMGLTIGWLLGKIAEQSINELSEQERS
jgi:hypothetical protein